MKFFAGIIEKCQPISYLVMNTVKRSKFTKKNKTKSEVCSNLLEGNFVIGFLLTYSNCTSGILNVGRVFVGEIDEHSEKITEGTSSINITSDVSLTWFKISNKAIFKNFTPWATPS